MPNTVGNISFDEKGVCNQCLAFDRTEKTDFKEREDKLIELFNRYKGKGSQKYDILVPYSGGKDSSYVLYFCKKYGMTPLAFNFNNLFQSDIGKRNMEHILSVLGCDMVQYTPNWNIAKRMCRKGIEISGDFCWFCNCGGYANSIRMALQFDISLVMFGEDIANGQIDFDSVEMFKKVYYDNCQHSVKIERYVQPDVTLEDMRFYEIPSDDELSKLTIAYMGSYIKWDKEYILDFIQNNLGWKPASEKDKNFNSKTEHIDCKYANIKEYMKYLKRGYATNTEHACIAIRKGNIDRNKGLLLSKKDSIVPHNLKDFCDMVGLSVEEFHKDTLNNKVSCI